jgi:hypothetical protein
LPTQPARKDVSVFGFCVAACAAFVVLTALAMLLYPGGSHANHHSKAYSFTLNFFSDLGRRQALNGQPNPVCWFLFTTALTLAGTALASFFWGFARFFGRNSLWKGISWLGTAWGVLAGICFVGVAWAPADVNGWLHAQFVKGAFQSFLLAVALYSAVIWFDGRYPKRMAWVFIAFAILLFSYITLLIKGPSSRTAAGLHIQVIGQKLIVYASILCTSTQAAAAHFFARRAGIKPTETP